MLDATVAGPVNYQYLDYLASGPWIDRQQDMGSRPRALDGTGTDDGDCDVVDWNLFETDTFSAADATNLLHYQNHVLAEGFQPSFYSSPGYPTHASIKAWVMNDPGERAQQIWASALYLKTNYGINIGYGVIIMNPACPTRFWRMTSRLWDPGSSPTG